MTIDLQTLRAAHAVLIVGGVLSLFALAGLALLAFLVGAVYRVARMCEYQKRLRGPGPTQRGEEQW